MRCWILVAIVAFAATACSTSNPVAPDQAGGLTPAGDCTPDMHPC